MKYVLFFSFFYVTTLSNAMQNSSLNKSDIINDELDTWIELHKKKKYHVHKDLVSVLAYHPTKPSLLVSGSDDMKLKGWDTQNNTPLFILPHYDKLTALTMSRDGHYMATGTQKGMVLEWDINKEKVTQTFGYSSSGYTASDYSRDDHWVGGLMYNRQGTMLASGDSNKIIRLFDMHEKSPFHVLACEQAILDIVRGYDDYQMVIALYNGTILLYDLRMHQITCTIEENAKGVISLVSLCNGSYVLSGDCKGKIYSFNTRTGKQRYSFEGHTDEGVHTLACNASNIIASGLLTTIRFWNLKNRTCVNTLACKDPISKVALNCKGTECAAGYIHEGNILITLMRLLLPEDDDDVPETNVYIPAK